MLDALGVHPANREGAGLVPIDVHDLLLRIFLLGWNWAKVDILACEIPPTENGDAWRQFNQTLVDKSDELLAPISVDVLEAMTGRGSHTTALARCMKHATKGIHPELCSNGRVSISKMSETKPSLHEPIEKGLPVRLVRWQLVEAVPNLMDMLSRSGNTNHGVGREQTIMQGLGRCHHLMRTYRDKKRYTNREHGCDLPSPWLRGFREHLLYILGAPLWRYRWTKPSRFRVFLKNVTS